MAKFVKGHSIRPHNPGRKKKESTTIKELYDKNAYEIAEKMIEMALKGDKDCLKHCDDRIHGRARQEIDAKIHAIASMTPEDYELATRQALIEEQKLLSEATVLDEIEASL